MKLFAAAALMALLTLPAHAETVTIDKAACRMMTRHRPAPDVAYQPGVDVHGRKVAPADLGGEMDYFELQDTISFELTTELARWLPNANFPYNKLGQSNAVLGQIAVTGDQVTFNGKPLTPEAQENLAVLCLEPKHKAR